MTQRAGSRIVRLEGSVRAYAWGSHRAIAGLQGRSHPTSMPEAELWFGAHPSDPSHLVVDGASCPLDEAIRDEPIGMLGAPTVARFGAQLPFLLKVLAIERPLSLQAHPSAAQAAAGHRMEESRGIAIGAPERTYRDSWPKPELLCAVSAVDALVGFREPMGTVALLAELGVPELEWLVRDLTVRGDGATTAAVERLLRWPVPERESLVASVAQRAKAVVGAGGCHAATAAWIVRLAGHHPADPGVVVAALLNLIRLRPGEAIHVPAGSLHAYLEGTAVEIMATSDNVVRGGLTAKHVDVDGLLDVLDATPFPAPRVAAVSTDGGHAYPTPVEHFALERLVPAESGIELRRRGAEILLAVGGSAQVQAVDSRLRLASGQAAFVPADAGPVTLCGPGPVFRATVGELPAG